MKKLTDYTSEELAAFEKVAQAQYQHYCDMGISLNMARGKPSTEQLDISDFLLNANKERIGVKAEDGTDCRNYGDLCGIPECRRLFAEMLGVDAGNVIACGNSSLSLMYDYISQCCTHGVAGGEPWIYDKKRKFIAVVPGYDRHFAIAEHFGFELVNVPMTDEGPDMGAVNELIKDSSVKGMFCVPKYSNPDGVTYSQKTVEMLSAMQPAARDFRVIWDEAYIVHDLYEEKDELANVFDVAKKYGTEDRFIAFASTSKITFAGAGIAAMAASSRNIEEILKRLGLQIISYDKINQLVHAHFFKNLNDIKAQMEKHAQILRPKFDTVLSVFEKELGGLGIAVWSKPRGGYFISLDVMTGSAKYVGELCRKCGLVLTNVGATFPYGKDPNDRNIRLAPSYPSCGELENAAEIVAACVKLAAVREINRER